MKKLSTVRMFLLFWLVFSSIGWLYIGIEHGEPFRQLIWNADTFGVMPDFYESVKDAWFLRPYDGNAIYPPMVYLLSWPLTRFLTGADWVENWLVNTIAPNAVFMGFFFFMGCTVVLFALIDARIKLTRPQFLLLILSFVLSPGFIFMIDRGNNLIFPTLLIAWFLCYYDSESPIRRYSALLSLALAASFKLYPAMFGIILLFEKRYRDALICAAMGAVCVFLPFAFTGGFSAIGKWISNIAALNTDYTENMRGFGYGYRINIGNCVDVLFLRYAGTTAPARLKSFVTVLLALVLLYILFFSRKKWQKVYAMTVAMIALPGFNYMYTSIYLILPLMVLMMEDGAQAVPGKVSRIYTLLFAVAFSVFPYGYFMLELPGANKLNLATFAVISAMYAGVALLFADTLATRFLRRKRAQMSAEPN